MCDSLCLCDDDVLMTALQGAPQIQICVFIPCGAALDAIQFMPSEIWFCFVFFKMLIRYLCKSDMFAKSVRPVLIFCASVHAAPSPQVALCVVASNWEFDAADLSIQYFLYFFLPLSNRQEGQ